MEYKSPLKLIEEYEISAKKSLGQNFLVDEGIIQNISRVIGDLSSKHIVEIGPGLGSLTKVILSKNPTQLTCIEKDLSFKKYLDDMSNNNKNTNILFQDALQTDYNNLSNENYSIIANLPYNIATNLIYTWIRNPKINQMFLMIQKEVAERIIAKPKTKDYGKLSISSQLCCECDILFDVPPEAFSPRPKVTSSFIYLKKREHILFNADLQKIDILTSHLFNFRRKMLRKSLSGICQNIENIFDKNILPTMRPEDLTIEQFCIISNKIS